MRLLFVTATDTMRGTSSGSSRPRGLRHEIYIGVELYRPAPDVPAAPLADGSQRSRREDWLSVLGIASPNRRGSNGHESEAGVAPRCQGRCDASFDPPSRDRRCPRADKRSFRHGTAKRATSRTSSPRERCCGWQERNRNHRGTSVPRASPLESQAAALRSDRPHAGRPGTQRSTGARRESDGSKKSAKPGTRGAAASSPPIHTSPDRRWMVSSGTEKCTSFRRRKVHHWSGFEAVVRRSGGVA